MMLSAFGTVVSLSPALVTVFSAILFTDTCAIIIHIIYTSCWLCVGTVGAVCTVCVVIGDDAYPTLKLIASITQGTEKDSTSQALIPTINIQAGGTTATNKEKPTSGITNKIGQGLKVGKVVIGGEGIVSDGPRSYIRSHLSCKVTKLLIYSKVINVI